MKDESDLGFGKKPTSMAILFAWFIFTFSKFSNVPGSEEKNKTGGLKKTGLLPYRFHPNRT